MSPTALAGGFVRELINGGKTIFHNFYDYINPICLCITMCGWMEYSGELNMVLSSSLTIQMDLIV